jgi:hypothetical protein
VKRRPPAPPAPWQPLGWFHISLFFLALAGPAAPAFSQIAPAAAYVDNVLETGPQPQQTSKDEADPADSAGWARSLRLDYSLSSQHGPSPSLMRAIAFSGFIDTPAYGALSLSASLSSQQANGIALDRTGPGTAAWRVDQRGMPFNGGWLGDHSAGTISTLTPYLGRSIGRIFLPNAPIYGAAGRWYQGDAIELNAASGTPGLFTGIDVNGFSRSGGRIDSAGGQMRIDNDPQGLSRTDAALQIIQARNVVDGGLASGQDVRSTWAALAWEGPAPWSAALSGKTAEAVAYRSGGLRVQGNWMESSTAGGRKATGGWMDAIWRTDWLQNTAGVFYLEPELRWGNETVASDLRGAYWRAEASARRWNLGWSVEASDSISGLYGRSSFASLYGRYHLDTRNSLGLTLALRSGSGAGESVQLSWDHTSGWGQTQWRANVLRAADMRTEFAGIDHVWTLPVPVTLATSLGWDHRRAQFASSTARSWGILTSFSPTGSLHIDASLRGASGNGDASLSANLGLAWSLNSNWSMIARYTETRGQDPQLAQVVSALTAATLTPVIPVQPTRSLQLVLRYEARAGSVLAPLGGAPGTGAGGLQGTVFFDADNNGRREATEAGVPNVVIVLDRRFLTRTDAQGHYDFPWVAAGAHVLQVQADNVPLPWSPVLRDPTPVSVVVRGTTTTDFALQRDR